MKMIGLLLQIDKTQSMPWVLCSVRKREGERLVENSLITRFILNPLNSLQKE